MKRVVKILSTAAALVIWLALTGQAVAETTDGFEVVIDKITVGDQTYSSPAELTASESDVLAIDFSYTYGGDSSKISNITWSVYIDDTSDGVLMAQGTFNNKEAEAEFTTSDVLSRQSAAGKTPANAASSLVYDYTIIVYVNYTEKVATTTNNNNNTYDDDDDLLDDDDDNTTTYTDTEKTSQALVTIQIDADPPAAVENVGSAIPGENSLQISWESVTVSESGNSESNVKYLFCVRETGKTEPTETTLEEMILSAVQNYQPAPEEDGDEEDESESATDDDDDTTDDDDDTADDDDDTADDDDDNDTADDDDDIVTDDDDDTTPVDDISGCINPAPDGVSGTEYTITGLQNEVEYEVRIKAQDAAGNVSSTWSEPMYGIPQPVDDFWEACQRTGCKEDGGFCYIATAAYGSYDADEVQLLRKFRDDVLLKFGPGKAFVQFYYENSPPLAEMVRTDSLLKYSTQAALFPVIEVLKVAYKWTWCERTVAMGLAMAFVFGFVFYRAKRRQP